ncbi:MAG: hypothetical protein ACOC0U_00955, partial [Desulfovibrionales bacterium]
MKKKPLDPVRPVGMELVFFYPCPFCGRKVPLLAPTIPEMGQCDACLKHFPLVPVDKRSVSFLKSISANGRAGIDP